MVAFCAPLFVFEIKVFVLLSGVENSKRTAEVELAWMKNLVGWKSRIFPKTKWRESAIQRVLLKKMPNIGFGITLQYCQDILMSV